MLVLRAGALPSRAVPLGGGAVLMVRPATSFEVSRSHAAVTRIVAGLIAGADAAETCAAALGEEFRKADFSDPVWIEAATDRLVGIELALLCNDGWTGVMRDTGRRDADDKPIVEPVAGEPTRELLALLLRDAVVAARVRSAIEAEIHEAQAEGNGSPASPSGAAGMVEPNAPIAVAST